MRSGDWGIRREPRLPRAGMSSTVGGMAALAAALLWSIGSVLFVSERREASPLLMSLVKSVVALAAFGLLFALAPVGFLGKPEGFAPLPSKDVFWLAASGILGITVADTLRFAAMVRIGVRRTTLLGLLEPAFAAMGALALGQRLPGPQAALGIAITAAGIAFVVFARTRGGDPASLATSLFAPSRARRFLFVSAGLAILGGIANALGIVVTKSVIERSGVLPAAWVRVSAAAIAIVIFESMRGRARAVWIECGRGLLRPKLLAASAVGGVVGFLCFQSSIAMSSPPVASALSNTVPLWAAPLAARYLGEQLSWRAVVGTLIGVGGAVLVVLS